MTICLAGIIALNDSNGVATFNKHFIQLFTQLKHNVIYLWVDTTSACQLTDSVEKKDKFLTIITLRKSFNEQYKKYRNYFRSGGSNAPLWIASGLALRTWLLDFHKHYNIDLIEISDGGGLGIFLIDQSLPPVVLTGHGSNLQISCFDYTAFDEHGEVIKRLEKLSYKHANAIIAHSPVNASILRTFTDQPVFTTLIPFIPCTPANKIEKKKTAMVVGKLRLIKGPTILSKALQLLKERGEEIAVEWFGNDTTMIKDYDSVSAYLKVNFADIYEKNFIWHNAKPEQEIIEEIQKASYIIIPSLLDTFNYVSVEAASLGKPIIITKSTGASYLFTAGENALVVEGNNENELAEAILQLHKNQELQTRLGDKGRRMVLEKLQPEIIVNDRIMVYEKVIKERKQQHSHFEENVAFLKNFTTKRRKFYFSLRAEMKRLYLKIK